MKLKESFFKASNPYSCTLGFDIPQTSVCLQRIYPRVLIVRLHQEKSASRAKLWSAPCKVQHDRVLVLRLCQWAQWFLVCMVESVTDHHTFDNWINGAETDLNQQLIHIQNAYQPTRILYTKDCVISKLKRNVDLAEKLSEMVQSMKTPGQHTKIYAFHIPQYWPGECWILTHNSVSHWLWILNAQIHKWSYLISVVG